VLGGRKTLLFVAVGLSAVAVAWYFAGGEEMVETDPPPSGLSLGQGERSRGPRMSTNAVTTTSGLQGTVPNMVGEDESPATFTLEENGFRVRVMTRTVSSQRLDGIVIQQLPTGGTRRIGTTVTIVVGTLR
jgi:hypothetical protein